MFSVGRHASKYVGAEAFQPVDISFPQALSKSDICSMFFF
jgi:hypothetical protein